MTAIDLIELIAEDSTGHNCNELDEKLKLTCPVCRCREWLENCGEGEEDDT